MEARGWPRSQEGRGVCGRSKGSLQDRALLLLLLASGVFQPLPWWALHIQLRESDPGPGEEGRKPPCHSDQDCYRRV